MAAACAVVRFCKQIGIYCRIRFRNILFDIRIKGIKTPCIRIDRDFAGDETKPDY